MTCKSLAEFLQKKDELLKDLPVAICFDGCLSPSEVRLVENILTDFYGISLCRR